MNYTKFARFLSVLLAVALLISAMPMVSFADEAETNEVTEETIVTDEIADELTVTEEATEAAPLFAYPTLYDTSVSNNYFKVLEEKVYDLAPGAQEYGFTLNNADGNDRKLVHVFAVDTKNEDIKVMPGYYGIDKLDPDNLALDGIDDKSQYWKAMELTKTVKYYEDMGYNVVGAMNTALAYDSNAPYGYMVWNGVVLGTPEVHKGAQTYLAIDNEGNCELRSMSTPLTGNEQTAISANFGWLVKDGVLQTKTVERTSSDASRSMIGIKADGTLIFCHVDGRQGDMVSGGLSNYEMGEMMLALGCVNAVNCDGGGSSTFVSKRAGEGYNTMRSMPSDGAERPTINSVILVSTAGASGDFSKVLFNSEYEYVAPGASMEIETIGQDSKNFTMEIPLEVSYRVAEENMGTIVNGVFTAGNNTGIATIEALYNGEIVGQYTVNVVSPKEFGFTSEETVLPYGKSMELEVVATYGDDNWAVCLNGAYTITLSDENAATVEGNTLTASEDETVAGVNVTATYIPDSSLTGVLKVSFGKGSEVLFDFESGIEYFLGVDEMYDWAEEVGAPAPIQNDGNYSENTDSETFFSTKENGGKVKNGNGALGLMLDYTNATFASWSYNMFFYTGEQIVFRDVANGKNATTLGCWVYIPEGAAGLAMQIQGVKNPDGTGGTGGHFYFTTVNGVKKNLNSCTEADIPESRWVYATVDLTAFGDYFATYPAMGNTGREPSFIRFYVKPTTAAVHEFYFDDFTLDYSSAVEDRVLPTITNICYATGDTAIELADKAVINGSMLTFSANVDDNQGIDGATAKIFVDGILLNTNLSGKVMSADACLAGGAHTVSFEISDKLGNQMKVTRTFTVSGESAITLGGHNESGLPAEYGSLYYIDIKAADLNALERISATLKLQSANTWENEGFITAPGFKVTSFTVNKYSNEATITVEKNAALMSLAETDNTVVSIPVRMWTWDGVNHVTDTAITAASQFATGYCPVVKVQCEVVKGSALYSDGCENSFGGNIDLETKINDNIYPWHYHDAELTVSSKEASCTENGYENRTYCETCMSVVDFGTKLEAKGHDYEIIDSKLVCACGYELTGNGLVEANGKIYALIDSKIVTGWQNINSKWVYADASTMEVKTGEFTVNELTYTADEDGYVIKGAWVTDANGTKYSFGPQFCKREWYEIDGEKYYFGTDSYMYTGLRFIVVNRNNVKEGYRVYKFGEDGKLLDEMLDAKGIMHNDIDGWFYLENGKSVYGGLMLIDGDYYYARTSGQLAVDTTYWVTKTNDLLPAANYQFGADGKMLNAPAVEPEEPETPEVNNGIASEGGKLWWYVDGVKTYAGLMLIDGNYYYARSSGEILTNTRYWITKTNGLLPAANYEFGADGKMLNAPAVEPEEPEIPETPEVKNGIVSEGGKLWWYVEGVKTYAGLMLINGDYYYARSSGEILTNRTYWITKTNDLLPAANYTFGADGKMIK